MGKAVKAVAGVVLMFVGVVVAIYNPQLGLRIAQFGQMLIVSNALDIVAQALAPGKPRATRNAQDVEYFGTTEPRRIIYGTNKVSGMNVIPPLTSGTSNANMHQVLALAGHEVNAITDVYFNQDLIAGAASPYAITPVTGTADDGLVVSGDYANKAWVRRYTGQPTSSPEAWTSDYILTNANALWTSAHKGSGVAYIALTYAYDEEVYKTGKPEVSCIVQGAECYDPRLDSSPGAAPTNPSYIAFTSNPALCLAHYLTHPAVGMGESASRIDWDLVVAAADICDEQVVIPAAASPSNYQNRYTCNIVLEVAATDDERRGNIKTLVGAMMGYCQYTGNSWKMYAGAAASSSFALTDDDVIGKMTFRTETPSNEKYNYVRGQFVDPDRNWQLSEFEPRSSSAYETTDGDRKPKEVSFPACTNQHEAQRNAMIVLKRSRLKRQVTLDLGMSAFRIRPWAVGTLTLAEMGWTAEPVRCLSWSFNPSGTIEATFLEEDSTCWDDPAVGDYGSATAASNPAPGTYTPPLPVSLTATGTADGIFLVWQPGASTVSQRFEIFEYAMASPDDPVFANATQIQTGLTGSSTLIPKTDTDIYYYWIKPYYQGVLGGQFPTGTGVPCAALTAAAGYRASAYPSTASVTVYMTQSGTTNNVTVSPVNGTAPFGYSWTRVSGDSSTTATASTSATTAFARTGMADQQTYSSYWLCSVTDSSASPGAVATAYVSVALTREDLH